MPDRQTFLSLVLTIKIRQCKINTTQTKSRKLSTLAAMALSHPKHNMILDMNSPKVRNFTIGIRVNN
jgi:hypothetical protein